MESNPKKSFGQKCFNPINYFESLIKTGLNLYHSYFEACMVQLSFLFASGITSSINSTNLMKFTKFFKSEKQIFCWRVYGTNAMRNLLLSKLPQSNKYKNFPVVPAACRTLYNGTSFSKLAPSQRRCLCHAII